ncbi:hypothetical protein Dimus_036365 [Dionaea muscipula]
MRIGPIGQSKFGFVSFVKLSFWPDYQLEALAVSDSQPRKQRSNWGYWLEVSSGGLDHKLRVVEGKRLADCVPFQQQDGVQEEVSDQGWMSVSKKGMSRPVASSPSYISLHKRFEGLEIEKSGDDGVMLSEHDTGQSSVYHEVGSVEHKGTE